MITGSYFDGDDPDEAGEIAEPTDGHVGDQPDFSAEEIAAADAALDRLAGEGDLPPAPPD